MNYKLQRKKMVQNHLLSRDISDPKVIEAFEKVPREKFVPNSVKDLAYTDRPLPIGQCQTISQPYIVAKMCQMLGLKGDEKILDVGTGSGYQAAILSCLAKKVISLEAVEPLAQKAQSTLQELNYNNVEVHHQDAKNGMEAEAPFQGIICAAAADSVPPPWKKQLSFGGKIVLPINKDSGQELMRITKTRQGFNQESFGSVAFVPLV